MFYRKAVNCSVQMTLYPKWGGEALQVDEYECAEKRNTVTRENARKALTIDRK